MHANVILFPAGMRLSTWLLTAAFVALAVRQRDRKPVLAAFAWLTTWEAIFQIAALSTGYLPLGVDGPIFYIVLAVAVLPFWWSTGIRPNWRLLTGALLVFALWLATGFHVNGHSLTGLSVGTEVLNETAKTLWGLAFLLPLLKREPSVSLANPT